ncbi:WASH complex subunit 5 [Culicoides brevitarsis]|uniref:WASH complex subunit 5 n=1 Tax=Culicoides brevitarsis TaxID=469753 RepID=UPI00307B4C3F
MSEFTAENNLCGQTLLQIVAAGNSIIAELLRLKDYVPSIFLLQSKEDTAKYGEILLDFSYFNISSAVDKAIETNQKLYELDDDIRIENFEILTRFYLAFESILLYAHELQNYVNDLNEGTFIQQTIESVLADEEGKQLLCESLYLYGAMLLILDLHIPGGVRERLLVAYNRYSAQKSHGGSNIDDVCKLMRSTGFSNDAKKSNNFAYPEEYFQRVKLDSIFVEMVIGRLRSDDIYNQFRVYPMPEHRPTALANQASMLYVCLFFSPRTLHAEPARMREIVDKFFPENWIVSIYMGVTINLLDAWDPFKAAKNALVNITDPQSVKEVTGKQEKLLNRLIKESRAILKEGVLTEQTLMNKLTKVLNLIREMNVAIRWLLLHTNPTVIDLGNKKCKQLRDQIISDLGGNHLGIFELLLNTSELELKVKEMIRELLAQRESRYNESKKEAIERIQDLSVAFSGTQPLMKIEKNDGLTTWFTEIKKTIETLDFENANLSGRKLVQLIRALEDVQAYHNLESNMQVKQYLLETRNFLHQMIHMLNIKDDVLVTLQFISDLSYGWRAIDNFTPTMQESIKKQPSLVIRLRATFLKLGSALDAPLLRINEAKSEDLVSVSQYYSNELINYVRKVIQIIPKTIFEVLAKIVALQTEIIKELPSKVAKDKVKDFAQLDERFLVAKLTYSVSVFTEGILMMKKTLVGVIELDPKELLEDGIRIELVKHISDALHNGLQFNSKAKNFELEPKLADLSKVIDGYKRSFEYIQDYMNIKGLKIWQEEMRRIICFNVERECNAFLNHKVSEWNSKYQSHTIPIPTYPGEADGAATFIGRLAKELLRITDPKCTCYIQHSSAWYEAKTPHKELINLKFMNKVVESIEISGLSGLDKLYAHMICAELMEIQTFFKKNVISNKQNTDILDQFGKELDLPSANLKTYNTASSKLSKNFSKYVQFLCQIGQKQILRRHISYELNISCRFKAKNYESSLRNFNNALLTDVKAHLIDPQTNSLPSQELFQELQENLTAAGIYEPYHKIYAPMTNNQYHGNFLLLMIVGQLPKFVFQASELVSKKVNMELDGHPLVVGILTLLRQFDAKDVVQEFLKGFCSFLTTAVQCQLSAKQQEISLDISNGFRFLQTFLNVAEMSQNVVKEFIPEIILTQFDFLTEKS